ncbi:MAG: PIN domain-containing protein [Acidimicrobiales bacterium]
MAFYLDTSAAVKLVLAEARSAAMTRWARDHEGQIVSSDLLRTELLRSTRRGAPDLMPRARQILDSITLLGLPVVIFERAADLGPDLLRSLDALHLAAALELGDELDGLVTYDEHRAAAAALHGVAVLSPK